MKNIFLICILSLCSLQLFSQRIVSGKVVDVSGNVVIGATVKQKGTDNGTATDVAGYFRLVMKNDASSKVEISMITYQRQEIETAGKDQISVILNEENIDLDEIVVVGYGTQTKASITGSISNVGYNQLKDVPVSSVTNALTGKVPGLVTRQMSGRPGGDDAALYIRGQASFNSSSPLVLVDGIERGFAQIDPEDIESISILKDASATAVYGVRGANGVVLVTTKRGDATGAPKIYFSSEFGKTQYNRVPKQLNAETTSILQREGTINEGYDPSNTANTNNYGVSEYDNYLYRTHLSPFTHPDNDYTDIFTKDGFQQKYNLRISGGNETVKYFVSVGYFDQTGMFETDVEKLKKHPTFQALIAASPAVDAALVNQDYDPSYLFKRLTTRSNIDVALSKDLKLSVDMNYRYTMQNRPAAYSIIDANSDGEGMRLFAQFIRNAPQSFPLINPNGSMAASQNRWRQNPLITMAYTGFRNSTKCNVESTISLNYNMREVLDGLSTDMKFSYDNDWGSWYGMGWRPYVYSYNTANGTYTQGLAGALPKMDSDRTALEPKTYAEWALRYKREFNKKHVVSGVLLANMNSTSSPDSGDEYNYVPHIYQAVIGRANYEYDARYLFEVNMGYNGSNRFAKGHRYDFFPAASVGWVLTNEHFIKENDLMNYVKFRGSIGQVGNDNLGSFSYYYNSTYVNGSGYSFGITPSSNITGLREGQQANDNVTWEKSTKYNVGFDSRWFKSNVVFNMDFFKERRSDILCSPNRYTLSSGVTNLPPFNIGIVENKGFEIELGWKKLKKDYSYYATGILSYARNNIVEMSEANQPYDYLYQRGNPIDQFIGYVSDGFFNSYEEIAASPQQFGLTNLKPGDLKYKDINGDGIVDENDRMPIGHSIVPEMTFSLSLGGDYKGFDVGVLFQGATRNSVYLTSDLGWDNSFGCYFDQHLDRWTPETAATASYPRLQKGALAAHQNYYLSDYWLMDGSYLRVKNVQFGYTFSKKALKHLPISSLRIYASGYNLYTWDFVKIVDPEYDPDNSNGYVYPQQKVYNFGVNLTF